MKIIKMIALLLMATIIVISCSKDDDENGNVDCTVEIQAALTAINTFESSPTAANCEAAKAAIGTLDADCTSSLTAAQQAQIDDALAADCNILDCTVEIQAVLTAINTFESSPIAANCEAAKAAIGALDADCTSSLTAAQQAQIDDALAADCNVLDCADEIQAVLTAINTFESSPTVANCEAAKTAIGALDDDCTSGLTTAEQTKINIALATDCNILDCEDELEAAVAAVVVFEVAPNQASCEAAKAAIEVLLDAECLPTLTPTQQTQVDEVLAADCSALSNITCALLVADVVAKLAVFNDNKTNANCLAAQAAAQKVKDEGCYDDLPALQKNAVDIVLNYNCAQHN